MGHSPSRPVGREKKSVRHGTIKGKAYKCHEIPWQKRGSLVSNSQAQRVARKKGI